MKKLYQKQFKQNIFYDYITVFTFFSLIVSRHWVKPLLSRMIRLVFFFGGYMYVPQNGRRATRKEAPILLIVPHSSFFDTALVSVLDCPGVVVRDFTAKAPFFGGKNRMM